MLFDDYQDIEAFNLRLAMLRNEKGVSAREMSLSLGQNSSYISSIETGKNQPSLISFFNICEYFGITPCEFFNYTSRYPIHLNHLNCYLEQLSQNQIDNIIDVVKDMKDGK